MKVGIIQSNFVPWRGYFDIIDDVDLFIFYDDVQFTKNDWRNRNKIKTDQGPVWLTVPVHHRRLSQLICETAIDRSQDWSRRHLALLDKWYSGAPYFLDYRDELSEILNHPFGTISELNVALCLWVMEKLGIRTRIRMSSEFGAAGARVDRLIDLLKRAGATEYLSGPAGRSYLDEAVLARHGIALEYKTYEYPPYPQLWGEFIGEVSVLDLLFNSGPGARSFLKSRKPVLTTAGL